MLDSTHCYRGVVILLIALSYEAVIFIMSVLCFCRDEESNHTVVATARGVFDSNGGVLESKETGVSIIIPKGAIPEAVQQEIYFKVCQDNSILPPLDKEKGKIH